MNPNDASQIIEYLTQGKYLLAVGVALVAIAQLVKLGLGSLFPWFKTSQLGGYIVGFGTSALIYFGTALEQGVAITWQLASISLVMAFAASGKYEMGKDVVRFTRTKMRLARIRAQAIDTTPSGGILRLARPIIVPVRQTFSVFAFAGILVGLSILPLAILPSSGCSAAQKAAASSTLIDCAKQDFVGLVGPATQALEGPDWKGDLAKLEGPGLIDAVACAVRVVIAVLDASHSGTPATSVSPMRAHAAEYLSTKHFVKE